MNDYIKALKSAKGETDNPLHVDVLKALIEDARRFGGEAQAAGGGTGSNNPPPDPKP